MESSDEETAKTAIESYAGRVARLSDGARAVGYLYPFDNTRAAVRARPWRRGVPEEVALGWLVEWTDPSRAQNGYTDEAGDVGGPKDVIEVAEDWRAGRHRRADEWFFIEWLGAEEAAQVARRFGWQPPS